MSSRHAGMCSMSFFLFSAGYISCMKKLDTMDAIIIYCIYMSRSRSACSRSILHVIFYFTLIIKPNVNWSFCFKREAYGHDIG